LLPLAPYKNRRRTTYFSCTSAKKEKSKDRFAWGKRRKRKEGRRGRWTRLRGARPAMDSFSLRKREGGKVHRDRVSRNNRAPNKGRKREGKGKSGKNRQSVWGRSHKKRGGACALSSKKRQEDNRPSARKGKKRRRERLPRSPPSSSGGGTSQFHL